MFYGGMSNVPGAPGNFPKKFPAGGPPLPLAGIPGSSNLPGAIGNMGGIQNAQFFGGPQLGQLPAGFVNKTLA